ncbi:hypothetical protein A2U01_0110051, partial [Trifolium medium]|nr:hypothetical protein [Trifolium medium]
EAEIQGKNLRIVDRQSGTSEREISEVAGTKTGTLDDLTNNHGATVKGPTRQKRNTHV